jgi:hypothetical protein
MKTMQQGDRVAVKVIDGKEVVRLFWGEKKGMILVTDEAGYEKLKDGSEFPWPMAFHPEEVRVLKS